MSDFLSKLTPFVQNRVAQIQLPDSIPENKINFCSIFSPNHHPVIISEIKFASPSRGKIYPGTLNCADIARAYLKNHASALSILTEPHFFKGDINYIKKIRDKFPAVPILCKDFILSENQITQALCYGANAILLIVAFLEPKLLKKLYNYAISVNLTPLIEIHDKTELDIALELNPKIIGINNRNLNTLDINLNTSRILIKHIPKDIYTVCESGLSTYAEIQEMRQLGFDGFLIGTQFMHSSNPGEALHKLMQGELDAR